MARDTFTRTTTYGLGTGWTWSNFDTVYSNASDSAWFVDGTRVRIPSDDNGPFDSYSYNAGVPSTGTIQYDLYLPALSAYNGSAGFWPWIVFYANGSGFSFFWLNRQVYGATPKMSFGPVAGVGGYNLDITPDNWYTFKMSYSTSGNLAWFKGWLTGTPEPGWQYVTTGTTGGPTATPLLDFYVSSSSNIVSYFDNFVVSDAFNASELTLDAELFVPGQSNFKIDAYFKKTQATSFTLNSLFTNGSILRHYRDRDHTGMLSASDILLAADIDVYPAGTSVASVVDDLLLRIEEQT